MKDSSIVAGLDLNGCHVLSCSPESNRLLIIALDRRPCGPKRDADLKIFLIDQVQSSRPSLRGLDRKNGRIRGPRTKG
jgi:hypothetical protein